MKIILSLLVLLTFTSCVNAQKILFLDAGHGGHDQGAIATTGVSEAEINRAIVAEIKTLAESKGMKVVLLNAENEYTTFADRTKKANSYKLGNGANAVLISIHTNFSEDPKMAGSEIFILKSDERTEGSLELAKKMGVALNATIQEKGLPILRGITIPAILIETGYLSNEQEGLDLQNPDMRSLLAGKIVSVLE